MTAALTLGAWGCTAVLDFQECRDNLDCQNAAGEPLMCNGDHECVPIPDPSTIECTVNTDCIDFFDDNHACNPSGVCANLVSEECPLVRWPAGQDPNRVVFIGSIMPVSPPFDEVFVPLQNAVQLAVDDFNEVELPGGDKIGWVACDDRGDEGTSLAAARHLTNDVGVPAIVGPMFSEEVLATAQTVTIPGGVFMISPTATSKLITALDDGGLVWRTISSDIYQASALADRLAELDPAPQSVAVMTKSDVYGLGLLEDIQGPLASMLPPGGLTVAMYADPASVTPDGFVDEASQAVASAFLSDPDTVVVLGTSEAETLVLLYLQAWAGDPASPPLPPRFIVSHGAVPVMENIVSQVAPGFRATLMPLLEGTAPIVFDEQNFAAYNVRYRLNFDEEDALTTSSLSYDAAMVTMLAMSAVPPEVGLSGAQIGAAMPRLSDKGAAPVSFGDDGFVVQARNALVAGGNVDLRGVSGELDFDANAGEVRTNLLGWGVTPRGGDPEVPLLTPLRLYSLDAPPAVSGTWSDLMQ